jgi:hypothetical protein
LPFFAAPFGLSAKVPQQGLRMIDFRRTGIFLAEGRTKAATVVVLLAGLASLAGGLAGCSAGSILGGQPQPAAAPAPEPAGGGPEAGAPATAAPPVDLAGKWQLAAAAGGACVMNFSDAPKSAAPSPDPIPQGAIAPEAGCPGNFFTSRKWTFEQGKLIIRDFKGRPLAELSYLGAHFEGHDKNGGALTLSKQL